MTILGVTASSIYKSNASYDSIATVNAPGGTSSVTISNIPQTYKHLELRIIGYDFTSYSVNITYNSITGSYNYTWGYWNSNANSGSSTSGTTRASIYPYWGVSSYANINVVDIYNYASTTMKKPWLSWGATTTTSSSSTMIGYAGGSQTLSSAAITDLTISTVATLSALTRVCLYGIKA